MKPILFSYISVLCLFVSFNSAWADKVTNDALAEQVVEQYGNIALAVFEDSLSTAQNLQTAIDALIEAPSEKTLQAAKDAWKQSRIPYQQSEVFRFGNGIVDDWEGQLNAWPLDEGLIDYVAKSYSYEMGNEGAQANIIANSSLTLGSDTLDLSVITPELLASLNELAGSEANVATGYHAIEFLLWGQDLNGTDAGAGERTYTDYAKGDVCTNGDCARRGQYLQATAQLLIDDLQSMVSEWQAGEENYRAELASDAPQNVLRKMLFGMGSLSLGELAGERLKVALEANSPEDEHDCFSDNTHISHYYDAKGVQNIYLGTYTRVDGSVVAGASLSDLVAEKDVSLDKKMKEQLSTTDSALQEMVDLAESGKMAFDQMIASDNKAGNLVVVTSIQALVEQTSTIEAVSTLLGVDNLEPDTADHDF